MNFKTLFITALGAGITISAGAQTTTVPAASDKDHGFSIGLNTGICGNPLYVKDEYTGKPGGIVGIGLYYRFDKHWELGFATDYKLFSRRTPDYTGPGYESDTKHITYYPAISHGVLVNYHFQARKLDLYAGASVKLLVVFGYNGRNNLEIWNRPVDRSGFLPEVHFGVNYPLSRHWSLNAQAGIERMFPLAIVGSKPYTIIPSATIGVRFHF